MKNLFNKSLSQAEKNHIKYNLILLVLIPILSAFSSLKDLSILLFVIFIISNIFLGYEFIHHKN